MLLKAWDWIEVHILEKYFTREIPVLVVFVLVAAIATNQSVHLPIRVFKGVDWSGLNNYLIFKSSFYNLLSLKDLYALYPLEHGDLFKYSPTFAMFMGVFAWLPNWAGLLLWNLLNVLVLFFGLKKLTLSDRKYNVWVMWFVVVELLTAAHNDQANGLITGLLLLAFVNLERSNYILSALQIVLTIYIKLFGAVFLIVALFYPGWRKFYLFAILWSLVLFLSPLVLVPADYLISSYLDWYELLIMDHAGSIGWSMRGVLIAILNVNVPNILVLIVGVLSLFIPIIVRMSFQLRYKDRLLYFLSLLIWVVIFNHKAEGATYIIAVTAVGIWFFVQKRTPYSIILILLTFVFTSFIDRKGIFPEELRNGLFVEYVVKAIPCIFVWLIMQYEMMVITRSDDQLDLN